MFPYQEDQVEEAIFYRSSGSNYACFHLGNGCLVSPALARGVVVLILWLELFARLVIGIHYLFKVWFLRTSHDISGVAGSESIVPVCSF